MNATTFSAREGAEGLLSGVSTVWPRSSSSLYGPERDASSRRIGLELAARRAHRPSNVNRDDFSFNKCYPCSRLTLPANEGALHEVYKRTIAFGGHPNERGVLSATTRTDTGGTYTYAVGRNSAKVAGVLPISS